MNGFPSESSVRAGLVVSSGNFLMASRNIETLVPGLRILRTYKPEWLRSDVVAGLSVAAVALPISIAYAQLAGFPPVVGIYSAFCRRSLMLCSARHDS